MPQVCVVYDIYHMISIHCDVIYYMYDMTYSKAAAP